MDDAELNSEAVLSWSRFYVQRVFVPILLCLGITGNTITVMVLTRRRMRSSTNTYLSALAVADIIQLIFGFFLSFEHYNNIHDKKYELYWRFYGLTHWLCDAASSTSAWLAVSFTVERYVAVCYPMKGRVFCTERRAKSIIVIVYIFCLLTTATTAFEYQLAFNEECLEECPAPKNQFSSNNNTFFQNLRFSQTEAIYPNFNAYDQYFQHQLKHILSNCSSHPHVILLPIFPDLRLPKRAQAETLRTEHEIVEGVASTWSDHTAPNQDIDDNRNYTVVKNKTCCLQNLTVYVEPTELGKSQMYTDFIYWYSALVFGIIPLALIATFNCFLIKAVYTSQKLRRVMTNSQENISFTNEKRITIMLIGVVFIFLFCNAPTACYLIYSHFHKPKTKVEANIMLILGNFFNLLVMLNAPCNFLIYCLLSRKFRGTFRKIFWERKNKGTQLEAETILLSSSMKSKDRFHASRHGLMKRNASEYRTPRNLETQSLTSIPRSKSLMTRTVGHAKSSDLNV